QRLAPLATGAQLRGDVVGLVVLGQQRVDVGLRDRLDPLDEVVHAPGVHRRAEPDLRLGLVALGDGDAAHGVTEPGEPQVGQRVPAGGGAGPGADLGAHGRVRGVADHRLAGRGHAGGEVGELAVAVGRLVEVHEVHVDVRPGQLDIGLRVQVQHRLGERV